MKIAGYVYSLISLNNMLVMCVFTVDRKKIKYMIKSVIRRVVIFSWWHKGETLPEREIQAVSKTQIKFI